MPWSPHDQLKLIALDREGLQVISAHLQDVCVKRGDMAYLPKQNRFALSGMRYDWAGAKHGAEERIGTVLCFDRVTKVSHIGLQGRGADETMNLLGVTFDKTEAPSGMVFLTFADGSIIRLDVECLEVDLRDVGPRVQACDCEGHILTRAEAE
jgi:Protein of unknown function (DUF2948)